MIDMFIVLTVLMVSGHMLLTKIIDFIYIHIYVLYESQFHNGKVVEKEAHRQINR